jgi:UDP-glucose 4-epimerase
MTVLVTGGRGYLGRYVVDGLLRDGHTVVDYNRDLGPGARHEQHTPVLGELSDIPRLLTVVKEQGVERIVHTAGQSHPDVSLEMPLATVESNVTGTCCVLEAARLSGIRRVVVFSSECAYGHTPPGTVPESTPLRPRTPYGVTKAATEMLGRSYNECFGMDVIALRVSEVYGPGQIMQEVVRDAIRAAVRGEAFRLAHGRDQKLQLVHVTDVAAATLAACFAGVHASSVYNVTGGVQPTLDEVLRLLAELVPGATFAVGPGEIGGDRQGLFETDLARRELGYEPHVALRDGLGEYVEWLRENEF